MAKKTKMNVISIFDGKQDATEVFISLIAERIRKKNLLVEKEFVCYDRDKVQVTGGLASGLCG